MDFSQKPLRTVLRTYLEDSYLDGSCVPLALAMWRRPSLAAKLLRCRPVPVCGRYPALYGLLAALLRQYGAKACTDMDALLTACCRIRPLTVYELAQLPLFLQAAAVTWGKKLPFLQWDAHRAEERYSIAERLLAEEPAGIYPHLSAAGRAECRRMVARKARRQGNSETAVAADAAARAFRGGTHAAALLLAERQRQEDTAAKAFKTAAVCAAGLGAIPLCVLLGQSWVLPLIWGALLGITLPLSRLALRLYLPPCRHLPFGRISLPAAAHTPVVREYRHIHPDTPKAVLLAGGEYALLLTDNGASRAYYRRRALLPADGDDLLHPPGIFFSVQGDADLCLTAAPAYREPTACSVRFEDRCVRYIYSGAAIDGLLTVAVHPGGYGDIRTLRLHNRTPQALQLTVNISLPFAGIRTPDTRCGMLLIRRRQGAPYIGIGFAEETECTEHTDRLCLSVRLPVGATVQYSLLTAVGRSREEVRCAFGALRENAALMPDAGAQSALPHRFSDRVLPHLAGPPDCGRSVRKAVESNTLPPSALRRFGIRLSHPYILLTVHNAADAVRAMPYLRGIRTLYRCGIPCGMVIAAPDEAAARAAREAVGHSDCASLCGRRGIVRIVCRPSAEELCLLTAYAAHDAARDSEGLGQLRTAFAPLFFEDGALFVRVDNTVRTHGRIGMLTAAVRDGVLHITNPTKQAVACAAALLIAPVGRSAVLENGGNHITLHDSGRHITVSEKGGITGFLCRRTAFYEGVWAPETGPYPYPCAAAVCHRTVGAEQTVTVRLRIRITPS